MISLKSGQDRLGPAGLHVKTFGNKFRKERERQRFSIEDVAGVTKIGPRMLKAIEDENFDALPGGIFNKGFIRAYARHLGMNPEDAIAEYLACLQRQQIDAELASNPEPTTARAANKKRQPSSPPEPPAESQTTAPQIEDELPHLHLPKPEHVRPRRRDFPVESDSRIPWKLIAVAAVAIVLAAILWTRHARRVHSQSAKPPDPVSAHTPEPVIESPVASLVSNPPPPNSVPAKSSPHLIFTATKVESTQPANYISSGITSRTQPTNPAEHAQASATDDPPAQTNPSANGAASSPAAQLRLIIRATETSWISITADGQPVAHETLIAPDWD